VVEGGGGVEVRQWRLHVTRYLFQGLRRQIAVTGLSIVEELQEWGRAGRYGQGLHPTLSRSMMHNFVNSSYFITGRLS
jgi:hypothetical protein